MCLKRSQGGWGINRFDFILRYIVLKSKLEIDALRQTEITAEQKRNFYDHFSG